MDPDSSYCTANVGPPLSLCTLVILGIICIRSPFSKEPGLFALLMCLIGDAFIASMIIVCSLYYFFHLAALIGIQVLIVVLWYKNMLEWETTRIVATTDDSV